MKKYRNMSVEEILAAQKKSAALRIVGYVIAVLVILLSLGAYWYSVLSIISSLTLVVAGFLFLRLIGRLQKLRYGKIELILMDDCDCEKYLAVYQALRAKKPQKNRMDTINIAKGYFFKGDFAATKQELSTIKKEELKGKSWIPYLNVALQNYLELGELQHARAVRQELEKYEANQKSGSPAARLAANLIQYTDFAEAFRRKDYETARGLQESVRSLSNHAAQLSLLYYRMAVMELSAVEKEEAKEHLEYVREYGGQIFVREEAEKLLKEEFEIQ